MKPLFLTLGLLAAITSADDVYFSLAAYSPNNLQLDGKVIHAVDSNFIIGALRPTTSCDLFDPSDCPPGNTTLVNQDMTTLAAAVPGGQFIFVSPDGSITYSAPHSSRRPPGSQMGGFDGYQMIGHCDAGNPISIFTWQSEDGPTGLWACQTKPGVPIGTRAVLKASTGAFGGAGCLPIQALQIHQFGKAFAAWEYT